MAIAQRELVERKRWLSREQFLADWAVAHILPGPNIVNLAVIFGDRKFGALGAIACVSGLVVLPLFLLLILGWGFAFVGTHASVVSALKGVGVVVAALIASTAVKLTPALLSHPAGKGFCALVTGTTLFGIVHFRLPLQWVLLGMGGAAFVWTAVALRQEHLR